MKRYIRAFRGDDYFGKSERDVCGDLITKLCHGWLISKRMSDDSKPFSLRGVAKFLQEEYPDRCTTYELKWGSETQEEEFDLYTVLGALEGMCYNNEAVEVADGFYYVGSYADWKKDADAQARLANMTGYTYEPL